MTEAAERAAPARPVLRHQALTAPSGTPLDRVRLTDQWRLAVVLQGAALLAHLEHGGWHLSAGWQPARLDADGRLRVGPAHRGRMSELPQVQLVSLVRRLFGNDTIAGRGVARRAMRRLLEGWRQTLAWQPADRMVAEILDLAPFLWQPAFAPARTALVAEHRQRGRRQLWVAGPGPSRRRLLAAAPRRAALEALLDEERGRALWCGWRAAPAEDPRALAAAGKLERAAAVWHRRPPRGSAEALACARTLYALGRFERALEALRGARGMATRLLRARCQLALGELGAAHATVRRLAAARPTGAAMVELAETAVRILANRGELAAIPDWVARARAAGRGPWKLRAGLLAALAAWDRGDPKAMRRYLAETEAAREDPEIAWRWHHARSLYCQIKKDGAGVVAHVGAALGGARRRLSRGRAGRLWSELALGRVLTDDLPGAERACRHAVRLLGACDGAARTTLALYNLAEVRVRRGRLSGVERIIEGSTGANRRVGNVRGLVSDQELWMRFELAQGRAAAALARWRELARPGRGGTGGTLAVLAARAYGWQGRAEEADGVLGRALPAEIADLEPEERPALLAHAGRLDDAVRWAHATPWSALWGRLAAAAQPPPSVWESFDALEPFRAARLVFDIELLRAGTVPPGRVAAAVATLRRCGAAPLAELLERRAGSPWLAVERYLTGAHTDPVAAASALLAAAGAGGARLSWWHGEQETVLIAGRGGPEVITAERDGGRWQLHAARADRVTRVFFQLAIAHLRAPDRAHRRAPDSARAGSGLIGESAALIAALTRLERLAGAELPLLVLGESGTGKELAARHVHRLSPRARQSFLAVNCAALSETLLLSDLFGHVRGAFTGADRDRPGVFESASGGTVFLDEIGDLPSAAQGALLRVLQEGEIRRQGESHVRRVDVRVVAATHRDLSQMVDDGTFRQDLFFRLKVATVELPPLRRRGDDVSLLTEHFLGRRAGARRSRLTAAARRALAAHPWPGNVRELKNVLEVAATLAGDQAIDAEHLDLPADGEAAPPPSATYHERLVSFRRQLIATALDESGGRQAAAARRLGLSRQALSHMIRQLGMR